MSAKNTYRDNKNSNQRYHNETIQSTQNFLQSEIRVESETRISISSQMTSSNQQSTHGYRVLKCFCGCTQLTESQIENFAMMNIQGLVNHHQGNNLLKTFFKIGHKSDKSQALIYLECYELCNKILENIERKSEMLDDLYELVPSFVWEEKLSNAKTNVETIKLLKDLQIECLNEIQCHNDFDRFRRELLRKIGK